MPNEVSTRRSGPTSTLNIRMSPEAVKDLRALSGGSKHKLGFTIEKLVVAEVARLGGRHEERKRITKAIADV